MIKSIQNIELITEAKTFESSTQDTSVCFIIDAFIKSNGKLIMRVSFKDLPFDFQQQIIIQLKTMS